MRASQPKTQTGQRLAGGVASILIVASATGCGEKSEPELSAPVTTPTVTAPSTTTAPATPTTPKAKKPAAPAQ